MKFPQSKYPVLPLVLRDFCFWAIWAAGPVHKKKLGANYEQLLRAFFSCFQGQFFFFNFFVNPIASKLKSCIIDLKKLNFFVVEWVCFWPYRYSSILNFTLNEKKNWYHFLRQMTRSQNDVENTSILNLVLSLEIR